MPRYKVKAPDGSTYTVNAPDGATEQDAIAYIQNQLSQEHASKPQGLTAPTRDSVDGMGFGDKLLAGAGSALTSGARGLEQVSALIGSVLPSGLGGDYYRNAHEQSKAAQSEQNRLDAPLLNTGAGIAGNVLGQVGQAAIGGAALKGLGLASSVIPNSYVGTALSGLTQGAVQPLTSGQDEWNRLGNASASAAAGVAGLGLTRGIAGLARVGKSVVDPFTDSGQNAIVRGTLKRFGGTDDLPLSPSKIAGVKATLAEQTGNPGISSLQNALSNSDPAYSRVFSDIRQANNAARYGLLKNIAGSEDDLASAIARRDHVAGIRYGQAFTDDASQRVAREYNNIAQGADNKGISIYGDDVLDSLLDRPAIRAAAKRASLIASNFGDDLGENPLGTLQGRHYTKMALDDMLNTAQQTGIGKSEQSAISAAKKALVSEMERQNPAYRQAREAFSDFSAPVNSIQIGRGLLNRVTSPQAEGLAQITDALGNPTITPSGFGSAVRQLDQIARKATGRKDVAAKGLLTDYQQEGIKNLLGDLSRQQVADNGAKSIGSNTVKNLASDNILNQISSATGVKGIAESGLLGRVSNLAGKIYSPFGIPDQIKERLAVVLSDPSSPQAAAILGSASKEERSLIIKYAKQVGVNIPRSTAIVAQSAASTQ